MLGLTVANIFGRFLKFWKSGIIYSSLRLHLQQFSSNRFKIMQGLLQRCGLIILKHLWSLFESFEIMALWNDLIFALQSIYLLNRSRQTSDVQDKFLMLICNCLILCATLLVLIWFDFFFIFQNSLWVSGSLEAGPLSLDNHVKS